MKQIALANLPLLHRSPVQHSANDPLANSVHSSVVAHPLWYVSVPLSSFEAYVALTQRFFGNVQFTLVWFLVQSANDMLLEH